MTADHLAIPILHPAVCMVSLSGAQRIFEYKIHQSIEIYVKWAACEKPKCDRATARGPSFLADLDSSLSQCRMLVTLALFAFVLLTGFNSAALAMDF